MKFVTITTEILFALLTMDNSFFSLTSFFETGAKNRFCLKIEKKENYLIFTPFSKIALDKDSFTHVK